MFQETEIMNALVGGASAAVVAVLARRVDVPAGRFLYAGFTLLLLGYVFTVLEGLAWAEGFNLAEHLCYAAAGLALLAFVVVAARGRNTHEEGP